ncbi:MAG: GAF domain-containing protein [Bacteriovoracaceae bacterium]|nr:GAF domain-containing protein [Bacteriovoracaceae bacterium]
MAEKSVQLKQLEELLTGFWLTDLANFSAFFFSEIPEINWIGFYLNDGKKLVLGPFIGKPACTTIAFDRGVCGYAFTHQKIMRVDDVDAFPDHIACDSASRSELVLPFFIEKKLVGVLDIDSPKLARFSQEDQDFFSQALKILEIKLKGQKFFPSTF